LWWSSFYPVFWRQSNICFVRVKNLHKIESVSRSVVNLVRFLGKWFQSLVFNIYSLAWWKILTIFWLLQHFCLPSWLDWLADANSRREQNIFLIVSLCCCCSQTRQCSMDSTKSCVEDIFPYSKPHAKQNFFCTNIQFLIRVQDGKRGACANIINKLTQA